MLGGMRWGGSKQTTHGGVIMGILSGLTKSTEHPSRVPKDGKRFDHRS